MGRQTHTAIYSTAARSPAAFAVHRHWSQRNAMRTLFSFFDPLVHKCLVNETEDSTARLYAYTLLCDWLCV